LVKELFLIDSARLDTRRFENENYKVLWGCAKNVFFNIENQILFHLDFYLFGISHGF